MHSTQVFTGLVVLDLATFRCYRQRFHIKLGKNKALRYGGLFTRQWIYFFLWSRDKAVRNNP